MKYNMSDIMKSAWNIFKKGTMTFANALRMAWRNAKAVAKAIAMATEEVHTWYGWTLIGKEVAHDSKCLFQTVIEDITTKSGFRTISFFGASQVVPLGSQN